jgi:spore coat protein U-like protein
MKHCTAIVIGALASIVPIVADAATAGSNFNVTASIQKNCAISNGGGNVAFGAYTPATGARTGSATVRVRCTIGTIFSVALSTGQEGSYAPRKMKDASNRKLEYNLYTTNAYSTVWGNGTGGTATQSGTGAGMGMPRAVSFTVYGQLPDNAANQAAAPSNSYADTITVTVTY